MKQATQHGYDKAFQWIESKGAELYGPGFRLHQEDHEIVTKLLAYFLRDEKAIARFGLNPGKGILLTGPVGAGKTALMNILRFVEKSECRYILKSCRDISFEFIREGYEVIHKYSARSFHIPGQQPKTYCFDDLGAEKSLKYYGNEANIMAEIILSRYGLFISRKMITHITTNLSAPEIEAYYGNRVRSRMREMFNLIAFHEDTNDKRA